MRKMSIIFRLIHAIYICLILMGNKNFQPTIKWGCQECDKWRKYHPWWIDPMRLFISNEQKHWARWLIAKDSLVVIYLLHLLSIHLSFNRCDSRTKSQYFSYLIMSKDILIWAMRKICLMFFGITSSTFVCHCTFQEIYLGVLLGLYTRAWTSNYIPLYFGI